ncbi:hypothetical protein ACLB2K_029251 [Fragaria x ananassa]
MNAAAENSSRLVMGPIWVPANRGKQWINPQSTDWFGLTEITGPALNHPHLASSHLLYTHVHQVNLEFIRVIKKQFDHKNCCEAVKDHPTFRDAPTPPVAPFDYSIASGSQTESPINLDEDVLLETPPSSIRRPMRQKAAKEARRKGKNKDDVGESMVQALLAITESNKISNEILRKKEENRCAEYERMMAFEEAKDDAK